AEWQTPSLAEDLRGPRRGAMRLLHPRNSTHCQGSFGRKSPSDPRRDPSSPVGEPVPLHGLHENFASRRARRKGNFWMTLFIKSATSPIKKSPFVLFCHTREIANRQLHALKNFEKEGSGKIWPRVIG